MRKIGSTLLATAFVAACAVPPQSAPVPVDSRKVLILSPQGVDPVKDTVGFNALAKNVTQAFAVEFLDQLSGRGFHAVNVLDQQPTPDVGQKMAIYSVKHLAAKVTIATIETKSVGADSQMQLRLQFIQGDFILSEGVPKGLRARTTIEKSYVLRGSRSGDTSLSMSDIAKDFADFILAAGRLQTSQRTNKDCKRHHNAMHATCEDTRT